MGIPPEGLMLNMMAMPMDSMYAVPLFWTDPHALYQVGSYIRDHITTRLRNRNNVFFQTQKSMHPEIGRFFLPFGYFWPAIATYLRSMSRFFCTRLSTEDGGIISTKWFCFNKSMVIYESWCEKSWGYPGTKGQNFDKIPTFWLHGIFGALWYLSNFFRDILMLISRWRVLIHWVSIVSIHDKYFPIFRRNTQNLRTCIVTCGCFRARETSHEWFNEKPCFKLRFCKRSVKCRGGWTWERFKVVQVLLPPRAGEFKSKATMTGVI